MKRVAIGELSFWLRNLVAEQLTPDPKSLSLGVASFRYTSPTTDSGEPLLVDSSRASAAVDVQSRTVLGDYSSIAGRVTLSGCDAALQRI
jgi:hypothetical protein